MKKRERRFEEKTICDICVKSKKDDRGKVIRCKVLNCLLGKAKGECFAFSDNPFFWEQVESEIKKYSRYF